MLQRAVHSLTSIPGGLVVLWLASFQALGQGGSALGEIDAIKLAGGTVHDTNAYMAFGLTRDGGATYVDTASSAEDIEIRAEIHPEPAFVGRSSDLFMVMRLEDGSWWMKGADGNWRQWSVRVPELVPFRADVTLTEVIPATFLSGMNSRFTGELRLFLAYADPDGNLQFNPVPFKVTISSDAVSDEELAFSLFENTILPNIIFGSCIGCHNDGTINNGSLFNAPYQYVLPNDPDYLETDFEVIRTLLNSRGKAYILDKASGRILHYGGTQLPAGSQQYMDFETFLTLLAP